MRPEDTDMEQPTAEEVQDVVQDEAYWDMLALMGEGALWGQTGAPSDAQRLEREQMRLIEMLERRN